MRGLGERGRDQNAQHRIVGDGAEKDVRRRRLFSRCQRVDQNVQSQRDQAEADGNAAKRAGRL